MILEVNEVNDTLRNVLQAYRLAALYSFLNDIKDKYIQYEYQKGEK